MSVPGNKGTVWVITAIITTFLQAYKLSPCEKAQSMVRRFSMLPLHWQGLSSPVFEGGWWPQCLPPFTFPSQLAHVKGERGRGERGRVQLTCGSDTGYGEQREFFRPTSFQSTVCAWTVMEFKQPSKTKLSGSVTFLKPRLFALWHMKMEKSRGRIHGYLLKKEISYVTIWYVTILTLQNILNST